jgi:hypothetical protein
MNSPSNRSALHILFVMLNPGYVNHYDGVLRRLSGRGHRVTLAYQSARNKDGVEHTAGQQLLRDLPQQVRIVRAAEPVDDRWTGLTVLLRQWQDYLRYMRPEFRDAYALRARAATETPPLLRRLSHAIALLGSSMPELMERFLRATERALPPNTAIRTFIDDSQPDLVLVTPLVSAASSQVDFVRAAQVRGIPAALCVASWDNLTNKGSMRVIPDRVFVWNDAQRREAVELHGVPTSNVVLTGAQLFDRWFRATPSRSRSEFLARVGLPPDRPFVLYLGSSRFIAPQEAPFVERWIRAIRAASDPDLATAGILIRPHPNNAVQFLGSDFTALGEVVMWPPFGADIFDPQYKQDYFDSMYFCSGAVGVNTSSMIEAGIVGRSVHTVLAPEFRHSQAGTLHFRHLTTEGGGLLHVASTLDEHVEALSASVARGPEPDPKSRRFVAAFVRPLGWEREAVDVLADEIEATASLRSRAVTRNALVHAAVRCALFPLAIVAMRRRGDAEEVSLRRLLVKVAVTLWVGVLRVRFAATRGGVRIGGAAKRTRLATRRIVRRTRHSIEHAGIRTRRAPWHMRKRYRRGVELTRKRMRRLPRTVARSPARLQRSARGMRKSAKQLLRRIPRRLPKRAARQARTVVHRFWYSVPQRFRSLARRIRRALSIAYRRPDQPAVPRRPPSVEAVAAISSDIGAVRDETGSAHERVNG